MIAHNTILITPHDGKKIIIKKKNDRNGGDSLFQRETLALDKQQG